MEEGMQMLTKQMNYYETIDQVNKYLVQYPEERERLSSLINQSNLDADLFSRNTLPGHVTASAIVIRKSKPNYLLMIFHQSLRKWLQPGGHVDPGENPQDAAIRELKEETSMNGKLHEFHKVNMFPIDIDIHSIPENLKKQEPRHYHYDFRYILFIEDENIGENSEQNEVSWVPFKEINNKNLQRIIYKVTKKLTSQGNGYDEN
jgi:8-oxo-dGTP pyrophosphatase MutT (NUDIX family)